MDSLQRLRVLVELAGRGSFSAAADALSYSQPAVSKQIAALEREVGTALVMRGVRPLRLTDAGEALVAHARAIGERVAAATAELDAIAALEAGRLRLGTFWSAGTTLVVQALAEFREHHPGVNLTLLEAGPESLSQAVRAGKLDLVVAYDYPSISYTLDEGLDSHHLVDDPSDLLIHRDHPLARRRTVTFADLRDEPWLLPTFGPEVPAQKLITAACANAGFEPNVIFQVNDCEMTKALVAANVGVALLPRLAIHPAHPQVASRPLKDGYRRRVLALRLEEARTPASDAFVALLRKYARAYPRLSSPART
jgi:DNA-binding transcriptional LysR family regulator